MIPDYISTPETNEGLDYVGRIFLEDYMKYGIIAELAQANGYAIHPFEDTRLYTHQVAALHQLFITHKDLVSDQDDDAYGRIIQIISAVYGASKGLLSFCD